MSSLAESSAERAVRRGVTHPEDEDLPGGETMALVGDDGRLVPIRGRVRIGNAPDNDLIVDDPYVSGWHCVLSCVGNRVRVVDCGSRNGTFLGGVRVGSAELLPGMRLAVGRTVLRVVVEGEGVSLAGTHSGGLLGRSVKMRELLSSIGMVAKTRAPVLILGESGTGKELAARALHEASGRSGAFVALNCGAISPELVESELFGHERGAFTGATGRRVGVFEEADGGTLFLDEVGELSPSLQPKLLRALETQMVRSVGGTGERRVNVRLVAATHRNLRAAVGEGTFRLDLFHRMSTVVLHMPALRDRMEDLPLLANQFLEEIVAEVGAKVLSPAAIAAMLRYDWPGNVRELRNAIQRAAILGGDVLRPQDVLPSLDAEAERPSLSDGGRIEEVERALIAQALRDSGGNRRAAALALRMPKSTLCDKVRRYGIDVDARRAPKR